jgi:hypothetical protein
VDESSKIFYLHFCIADLWLELQSRGTSVAQFQIDGLKASLTRRPFESSLVFSLQSLHLVTIFRTENKFWDKMFFGQVFVSDLWT